MSRSSWSIASSDIRARETRVFYLEPRGESWNLAPGRERTLVDIAPSEAQRTARWLSRYKKSDRTDETRVPTKTGSSNSKDFFSSQGRTYEREIDRWNRVPPRRSRPDSHLDTPWSWTRVSRLGHETTVEPWTSRWTIPRSFRSAKSDSADRNKLKQHPRRERTTPTGRTVEGLCMGVERSVGRRATCVFLNKNLSPHRRTLKK